VATGLAREFGEPFIRRRFAPPIGNPGPPPGGGGKGQLAIAAPTSLTATTVSSTAINLAWTDNASGETGFKIERKAGAGSYSQIGTAAANATSYNDTGLTASTLYTYRVRAYKGGRNGAYSNEASDTTDGATLLQDTFTDTDADDLITQHTPNVGPGWTRNSTTSSWLIQGNRARVTKTGTERDFAWMDSGDADVVISCKVFAQSASNLPGIIARLSDDESNCWIIHISPQSDTFAILQREADVNTSRASTSVTIDIQTLYTIEVTLSGSTITATLNGGNQIQYASATFNQTSTKHGISDFNDTSSFSEFDDFLVTA